jgi:hypothetical protein
MASATIPFSDLGERFGMQSKQDPATGRWFYLWDDMFPLDSHQHPYPNFAVQEAAKVFFGRGADWLRWRYRAGREYPLGYFVLDGIVLEPKRNQKGIRYYTLADIERMAYALTANGAIDGMMLANVLEIVLNIARLYESFKEDEIDDDDE